MTMMGHSIPIHEYNRIMNEWRATVEMLEKIRAENEELKKKIDKLEKDVDMSKVEVK